MRTTRIDTEAAEHLKAEYRRKEMYEMIRQQGALGVTALAERFGVSAMTVRRDLEALKCQGLVERAYGKAAPVQQVRLVEGDYEARKSTNTAQKLAIARRALGELRGLESIYVDSSSTCSALIELIPSDVSLTVYTNSVRVLNILLQKPWLRAFVFGGTLSHAAQSLDSTSALVAPKDVFVDAALISCCGYSEERLFNNDLISINERRVMLANANRRFLLADASKQSAGGLFTVCTWEMIDAFITDRAPDANIAGALGRRGIDLIIA